LEHCKCNLQFGRGSGRRAVQRHARGIHSEEVQRDAVVHSNHRGPRRAGSPGANESPMLSQSQEDTLLLKGLSPLDSRYYHRLAGLANFLSEWALFKYRLHVEVEWLITLSDLDPISDMRSLSESERN